jgi:hypothetical protein
MHTILTTSTTMPVLRLYVPAGRPSLTRVARRMPHRHSEAVRLTWQISVTR